MQQTFSKELRKLRIDHELRLADLSAKTGVSVTMLSAIETGERKPSTEFVDTVADKLKLSDDQRSALHVLAAKERRQVSVPVDEADEKSAELAVAFARRFESLDKKQVDELLKMLTK